ncbi:MULTISPECIES: ABC transporter ATP-binding protein [unclassified Rhizobium]|uniref:ABC transporter ATP-binding protein n=1 Tax=unclassified Rhizobium TaxID=2613769 RepID=UPI0007155AFA|nr:MULTISPECIES: ABC transporter ATP-binding protein [unclassified Rhizobium]KQS83535.1 histidinol phosphatase [Rhizobium sp. Leaf386]KQT03778.1 histidinol phosphatase [Rhizobium sp. Leaf391]KQU03628.1 histidinol phosphatase [Rhizobium sp. Leaf453]
MSVSVSDVYWSAGNTMIVNGISIEVSPGKMLGLLGPNGSGKSSLLRLICGLRKARSGVIALGDTDITRMPRLDIARRVAFVEQQATTEMQVTVLDAVRLGRTPHRGPLSPWNLVDDAAVNAALDHVGMRDRAHQLWHTLSGGERQRVHIARALAQMPKELLLDEPTNHLDIQHQLEILSLVARLPVTSIVALHDLNLAAMFCDTLAVLHRGKVVAAGAPEDVLTEELIADVFGVRAFIECSAHHRRRHIQYRLD